MAGQDVGIRIRVERQLRDSFQAACASEMRQVSDVLREFMQNFADTHHEGRQASLFLGRSKGNALERRCKMDDENNAKR